MSYYDDIINLPHHVSTKHPRMSMYNRSAQFSPSLPSQATRKPLRKQGESWKSTKVVLSRLEKRHGMKKSRLKKWNR